MSKQPRRPQGVSGPVSSSKAFDILIQKGESTSAFDIFQAGGATVRQNSEENDITLCLKKLVKRDIVTKLKALDQMSEYYRESSEDMIIPTISEWCKIYPRLTTAPQKQVKERAQNVLMSLFSRTKPIKREMERNISGIMGPWICCLHDNSREVRESSERAWKLAFSDESRQVQAIKIFLVPILDYMLINLTTSPENIKSDQKTTQEETDQIVECSLSSTLLGTSFVLKQIRSTFQNHIDICKHFNKIIHSPNLWAIYSTTTGASATTSLPLVRSAFCEFVITILQECPQLIEDTEVLNKTANALICNGFNERDGSVISALWPALLVLVRTYPNCWNEIHRPSDTIMPRLFALLRRSCPAPAHDVFYPALYPLVVAIPDDVMSLHKNGSEGFMDEFLCSLWKGVKSEYMTPTGITPLVESYIECWKHFTLQRSSDKDQYRRTLIQKHLLPVVLFSVTGKPIRANYNIYSQSFGKLLGKMSNHTQLSSLMNQEFWNPLIAILIQLIHFIPQPKPTAPTTEDPNNSKKSKSDKNKSEGYDSVLANTLVGVDPDQWIERLNQLLSIWRSITTETKLPNEILNISIEILLNRNKDTNTTVQALVLLDLLWSLVDWSEQTIEKIKQIPLIPLLQSIITDNSSDSEAQYWKAAINLLSRIVQLKSTVNEDDILKLMKDFVANADKHNPAVVNYFLVEFALTAKDLNPEIPNMSVKILTKLLRNVLHSNPTEKIDLSIACKKAVDNKIIDGNNTEELLKICHEYVLRATPTIDKFDAIITIIQPLINIMEKEWNTIISILEVCLLKISQCSYNKISGLQETENEKIDDQDIEEEDVEINEKENTTSNSDQENGEILGAFLDRWSNVISCVINKNEDYIPRVVIALDKCCDNITNELSKDNSISHSTYIRILSVISRLEINITGKNDLLIKWAKILYEDHFWNEILTSTEQPNLDYELPPFWFPNIQVENLCDNDERPQLYERFLWFAYYSIQDIKDLLPIEININVLTKTIFELTRASYCSIGKVSLSQCYENLLVGLDDSTKVEILIRCSRFSNKGLPSFLSGSYLLKYILLEDPRAVSIYLKYIKDNTDILVHNENVRRLIAFSNTLLNEGAIFQKELVSEIEELYGNINAKTENYEIKELQHLESYLCNVDILLTLQNFYSYNGDNTKLYDRLASQCVQLLQTTTTSPINTFGLAAFICKLITKVKRTIQLNNTDKFTEVLAKLLRKFIDEQSTESSYSLISVLETAHYTYKLWSECKSPALSMTMNTIIMDLILTTGNVLVQESTTNNKIYHNSLSNALLLIMEDSDTINNESLLKLDKDYKFGVRYLEFMRAFYITLYKTLRPTAINRKQNSSQKVDQSGMTKFHISIAKIVKFTHRLISLCLTSSYNTDVIKTYTYELGDPCSPTTPNSGYTTASANPEQLQGVTDEDMTDESLCPLPTVIAEILSHHPPSLIKNVANKRSLRSLSYALAAHQNNPLARLITFTFLSSWDLAFALQPQKDSFIKWVRSTQSLASSMEIIIVYMLSSVTGKTHKIGIVDLRESLLTNPVMDDTFFPSKIVESQLTTLSIGKSSGSIIQKLMRSFPSITRAWWSTVDNSITDVLEKFITTKISPKLVSVELDSINYNIANYKSQPPDPNDPADAELRQFLEDEEVTLKVLNNSRQVVVTYSKDDILVNITLSVPACYPLKAIEISEESSSRKNRGGVREDVWRMWLLKMTIMLFSQNTDLWKCVCLWCSNLAKHFAGIEACPICYSIVSQSNNRLPDLKCAVCKNSKFHSSCLYKWFKTAGNNSCPICRSPWY